MSEALCLLYSEYARQEYMVSLSKKKKTKSISIKLFGRYNEGTHEVLCEQEKTY